MSKSFPSGFLKAMNRPLMIIIICQTFSCSVKSDFDTIQVPKDYIIQMEWGAYSEENIRNHFFYHSSDFVVSIYSTIHKDSVYDISTHKINRETADSLYKLVLLHSRLFNVGDSLSMPQVDGYSLAMTLRQNSKSICNMYYAMPDLAINTQVAQIINMIARLAKRNTLFIHTQSKLKKEKRLTANNTK